MKIKRKLTKAQQAATKRNWHKGIISGMLKHTINMKNSNRLTFAEQVKIFKCKSILEEILADWKPTI